MSRCNVCAGTGEVIVNGLRKPCPYCNGTGKKTKKEN